jgi:hypothetical protein
MVGVVSRYIWLSGSTDQGDEPQDPARMLGERTAMTHLVILSISGACDRADCACSECYRASGARVHDDLSPVNHASLECIHPGRTPSQGRETEPH